MSETAIENDVREKILADPNVLLEDHDVMRALVAANEQSMGGNIVDLRGIAMTRLEARFDRLEDTHRNVIAAAYDNLAGTNQVHRAILRLMDATDARAFLHDLSTDVADHLRLEAVRLVLESETSDDPDLVGLGENVVVAAPGFIDQYLAVGSKMPVRQVTLRGVQPDNGDFYGDHAIQSEACLKLDLGDDRLPGMLVMGSENPHQFDPQQGADLLTFFTGVFERVMRRWLP